MRPSSFTNSRLISYETTDGLLMKGFLAISPLNCATIIHSYSKTHIQKFYGKLR